ncbi:shikimate kinase [Parahaliea aestuarii]|uniref:Shikimate kinase n=1 Tax=Parahaliea aestuarii TaxID=1852021 RepID=A0A5C8ZLG8_9GAMM|nr:shikimate kinase [Parahaliea aestuarii]TXS89313.1 shikimate kinase [Parahaliea aestuarii]
MRDPHLPSTISLIGMPGAGKSTVGVILAKLTGLAFSDTDLAIQLREDATLQEIVDGRGHLALRQIEEEVLLEVDLERAVISTGGSVVYSEAIMQRLREAGPVVYIRVDLPVLEERVAAAPLRGIASGAAQSFADIFSERTPLYEHYADITVDGCAGSADTVAALILAAVSAR